MFGKWMSRRAAITAAAGVPLSALATRARGREDSVADLIRAAEMKKRGVNSAATWITGRAWCVSRPDFTLMQPFWRTAAALRNQPGAARGTLPFSFQAPGS